MKNILFVITLSFLSLCVLAQEPEPEVQHANIAINTNRLFGKLVDKGTGKGVEAASVQLFHGATPYKDSLLRGMLTKANGDFNFTNLPPDSSFRLVISAIGFESIDQIIMVDVSSDNGKFAKDLGNLSLEPAIQQLSGVTVVSNKPALEMGIDRKVFNASKAITAVGGTAVDLMKNIPSVSVDLEGNVQLRNSPPQIFVDGRPTILTLDQIPAENIDKVELITNPSAKFDAASSGGIINIVLKKNKRVGLNGVISAGIGTPKVANGNLSLNLRQGKFNIFVNTGYNQSGGKAKGETERQNKSNGVVQDYFNQLSVNDRMRRFGSIRFGVDYFIDNRNTLTVTQFIGNGNFRNNETQNQQYLNNSKVMEYYGERYSAGKNEFRRRSTALNFKHNFPKEGREITADINYNYGKNNGGSEIENAYFLPDGTSYQPTSVVRNASNGSNQQLTFQADFANPMGADKKLEGGFRSYHNSFENVYDAFAVDNGQETKLPLSNNYEYKEMVNALYLTYSEKIKTFSYQLGLRAEHSKFTGTLIDSARKFGYEYPEKLRNIWDALFPSLFITKQIGEKDQVQFNYSRRIRRPNFWQINPYIDISDPVNLRMGNPLLKPEFINSFELNYSKDYKNGNLLAVLYFRNNPDDITEYSDTISTQQYEELKNAGVDPNAILNTFINAGVTNRYGAEFTLQHKASKNFDITPTINLQYRTVQAVVNDLDLSNEGFNWEAKLITNYKVESKRKFLNNFSFQLTGEYESPEVIPQGRRKSQYSMDFAMRKDFLKNNKATITFGINDVFNSNRWGTIYDTESFYQDAYRRWNVRNFRLTFSYKFGKADFSLMNRNNRKESNDD